MAGTFITFEGIDGAGKTTQIELFTARLTAEGRSVLRTREPGGDAIAEAIRSVVLDRSLQPMEALTEAYLYAASRAQHVRQVLLPALDAGKTVLCDRFLDSSLAYQGYGRMLGAERVLAINREAVGELEPDWTVMLLLDPSEARARMHTKKLDRIEAERLDFHQRVYEGFREIALKHSQRVFLADAALPVEKLSEMIYAAWKSRG